jgi:hypothetical protein
MRETRLKVFVRILNVNWDFRIRGVNVQHTSRDAGIKFDISHNMV